MTKTFGPFTVESMPRWHTIADIKRSNREAGFHFFDRARWLAYIAGECGPNGGPITGGIHKGRMRTL